MDHYCLILEAWDEAAIRATLERHGVEAGETKQRNGGLGKTASIFIRDADGNRVELKGPVE
jgi:extradiol dioxygenase family protein